MTKTIRTRFASLAVMFLAAGVPYAASAQQGPGAGPVPVPAGTIVGPPSLPRVPNQPAAVAPDPVSATSKAQAQAAQQAAAQAAAQVERQKQMFTVAGVPATYENVLKAAIRFGAVDMSSDRALDDFAKIYYCDMYQRLHDNEFQWRRVRVALRQSVEKEKATYPSTLYLEKDESFGQYDFSSGMLVLKGESAVNSRRLLLANADTETFCGSLVNFPGVIIAELPDPMRLDGVELTEDEAQAVVAGLVTSASTGDRMAYGRYTITINAGHQQHKDIPTRLDATLQNITLYQDSNYTRPFWTGMGSAEVFRDQENKLGNIGFKGIDPQVDLPPDDTKPLTATVGVGAAPHATAPPVGK